MQPVSLDYRRRVEDGINRERRFKYRFFDHGKAFSLYDVLFGSSQLIYEKHRGFR